LSDGSVRFLILETVLWRNRTNKKIFTQKENHDEKLAHRIMEAEKSPNLRNQSAGDPEKLTV